MNLFDFFRKKINNENTSKPFYENKNSLERYDWFSRTNPWYNVDKKIIDILIEKYGNDPMFEVFVITSMENNLVKKYSNIDTTNMPPEAICTIISMHLYQSGSDASLQFSKILKKGNKNPVKLTTLYDNTVNLLESSIIVEPNQMVGYIQLAALNILLNKGEKALEFVEKGLLSIKNFRENYSYAPFQKSSLDIIKNSKQYIDDAEKKLLELKEGI